MVLRLSWRSFIVDGSSPIVQAVQYEDVSANVTSPCNGPCTKPTLLPISNFTRLADPFTPVTRVVLDDANEVMYRPSLPYISARYDIWDPHSGLKSVNVALGTQRGAIDVMGPQDVPIQQRNFTLFLSGGVPIHVPLFVRVRGLNQAGWEILSASSALLLDPTPYVLQHPPSTLATWEATLTCAGNCVSLYIPFADPFPFGATR